MASGNRDHALTMRAAGQSFGAIGQALGVSRQRAWQLCQADAPTPVAHLLSPRIGREDLETWRGKVGLTVAAAERALGLSAGSWRYMLRAGARSAVVVCMGLVEETVVSVPPPTASVRSIARGRRGRGAAPLGGPVGMTRCNGGGGYEPRRARALPQRWRGTGGAAGFRNGRGAGMGG